MCGLTGLLDPAHHLSEIELDLTTTRMANTLTHRGPDDLGVWTDPGPGVGLGFRRLAIVDLSPEGHQPMVSGSGRYVLAFNGEIYNFQDLRVELEVIGYPFRSRSDTEVLLAGFERWGIEQTIIRTIGMFAIAVWDRHESQLTLARDRMGEKPLYYGKAGSAVVFGSELKALRVHPEFESTIDRDALSLYFRHDYVPAPRSIETGMSKLPPGTLVSIDANGEVETPRAYWSVVDAARSGLANPFTGGDGEAVDAFEALLRDAIRRQMVADVPLGAFLSGGIDSSTVVALMQAQSDRPVRTFTIGFDEDDYNEAIHAKTIARHLGTDHTETYVTPAEARVVIPNLPSYFDEPFADPSQIPTFLVAAMARQHVTVSLSGDAGDELFGGYRRYAESAFAWNKVKWLPAPVRRPRTVLAAASAMAAVRRRTGKGSDLSQRLVSAGSREERLAYRLQARTSGEFYRRSFVQWLPGVVLGVEPEHPLDAPGIASAAAIAGFPNQMMLIDQLSYLPDDIMVKVDRASMAVSLESRAPLLDHRVVEFAWRVPLHMKQRDGQTKWLLRALLARHVPTAMFDRPKQGFGVPVGAWLRGPLKEWATDLLSPATLKRQGYLDPAAIEPVLRDHMSGDVDWQHHLWIALMFQAWLAHRESASANPPLVQDRELAATG